MKTWTAATCWQLALSSSPCQQIQLRFSADEDTEDTVVGRLKYQLNKHRIRSDNIPKTKARRERRLQPLQKQSKMTALPHQHHLGDINVVLVITIIYSTKWQDRLWWPLLPASAVSEPMIVPIELQLMLCPPKDEGHISPGIHGPTRAAPSRKSGMLLRRAAATLQSRAELLNPCEGDKSDEVADLRCTDGWLRTTSTERHKCLSSLVGRVLVTDSTPGSISHAHFVVGTAEDYVKEKNISLGPVFPGTRAHMDKIHRGSQHRAPRKRQDCEGTQLSRSEAEVLVSQSRRRNNQACVQYRARAALAKTRFKSEDKHAAEILHNKRYGSGQRSQGCMRQQPCALNSEQPQLLLGQPILVVFQRHACGCLTRLLLRGATLTRYQMRAEPQSHGRH